MISELTVNVSRWILNRHQIQPAFNEKQTNFSELSISNTWTNKMWIICSVFVNKLLRFKWEKFWNWEVFSVDLWSSVSWVDPSIKILVVVQRITGDYFLFLWRLLQVSHANFTVHRLRGSRSAAYPTIQLRVAGYLGCGADVSKRQWWGGLGEEVHPQNFWFVENSVTGVLTSLFVIKW